ncbi:putative RNA-binding Zn ribbon-like protein [Luteibacter sp. HA06]
MQGDRTKNSSSVTKARRAFQNRSKNASAVWHDVRVCGNAINLRASRARHRKD